MPNVHGGLSAQSREVNGETDHLHMLVHHPPSLALSTLANSLTGVSSRHLRQELPAHIRRYLSGQHYWSPSYFAGSCGGAPLSIIKQHIQHQKHPDQPRATQACQAGSAPAGRKRPGFHRLELR